jgi:hypothetical protein
MAGFYSNGWNRRFAWTSGGCDLLLLCGLKADLPTI